MIEYHRIVNTMTKLEKSLREHESISVGVSGGSDSNIVVHMIATYFREYLPKVHFEFNNTGVEYRATLDHIEYMRNRYNITIEEIRGKSVPFAVKNYGSPILSKEFSRTVHYYMKGSKWATDKVEGTRDSSYVLSTKQRLLAEYLNTNNIPVSDMCCNIAKKEPHRKFLQKYCVDLVISGERKCEGGIRATAHTDCYESGKYDRKGNIRDKPKYDKYMPLYYWNDETKAYYKDHEGIKFSDCYEIWGMNRTGCVGCPFNSNVGEDLKLIKKYEPKMYDMCMNLFGESYELMDKFNVHRKKIMEVK